MAGINDAVRDAVPRGEAVLDFNLCGNPPSLTTVRRLPHGGNALQHTTYDIVYRDKKPRLYPRSFFSVYSRNRLYNRSKDKLTEATA